MLLTGDSPIVVSIVLIASNSVEAITGIGISYTKKRPPAKLKFTSLAKGKHNNLWFAEDVTSLTDGP
jgi:hypothetical protein